MVKHIVSSNFCICVWRASFCTVLSCSNSILILSICYVSVSYKLAFRSQVFVSCKSSSKDQSEINLVFWNCLQWYARQIALLYIKEWSKNLLICSIHKNKFIWFFTFICCLQCIQDHSCLTFPMACVPFHLRQLSELWHLPSCRQPGKFAVCLSSEWSHKGISLLCKVMPSKLHNRQMSGGLRIAKILLEGSCYNAKIRSHWVLVVEHRKPTTLDGKLKQRMVMKHLGAFQLPCLKECV